MNAAHEPYAELAAGYALGALDVADAARFELHVAEGCPECGRTLTEYAEALARVADDVRAVPPPDVRRDLLARARPAARPRRIPRALGWAASLAMAAGIAAIVTGNLVGNRYRVRLEELMRETDGLRAEIAVQLRTVTDLRRQIDEQGRTLTLVKAESAEQERTIALLGDPATRIVTLVGLKPSPDAQGRMIWNPRGGGLFVAADLPPAPEGKTYELWAIAAGKPLPAGVFPVGADGRAKVRVAPLEGVATVDVFAVTLEPAGGVPSPTGDMYLASKPA
jgi:anti-sigma-K factor RskA